METISLMLEFEATTPFKEASYITLSSEMKNKIPEGPYPKGFEPDEVFGTLPISNLSETFNPSFAYDIKQKNHLEKYIKAGGLPNFSKKSLVRGSAKIENLSLLNEDAKKLSARIFTDPDINVPAETISNPPVGTIYVDANNYEGNYGHVQKALDYDWLQNNGFTGEGVAIAILDSGINLKKLKAVKSDQKQSPPNLDQNFIWHPDRTDANIKPGTHPLKYSNHGTMSAYNALLCAPKGTLLDLPLLTQPKKNKIEPKLSSAVKAYTSLLDEILINYDRKYEAMVVNNSWSMPNSSYDYPVLHESRYGDNPSHIFRSCVRDLINAGVDVIFSAGNCGKNCMYQHWEKCKNPSTAKFETDFITGANSYEEVLTIGAVTTQSKKLTCYSNQGPGRINHNKPDIVAYSDFMGSGAFFDQYGKPIPDSGTSTATPIVSSVIAALRTKYDPQTLPPDRLNDIIRKTANPVDTQWKKGIGYGIINPRAIVEEIEKQMGMT